MEGGLNNYTDFEDETYNFDANTKILEHIIATVNYIILTLNICSCGLCSYAICKFKYMRTRTNYILLNFLFCIIADEIAMAALHLLIIKVICDTSSKVCHYLLRIIFGLKTNAFLICLLLALDWYLSANCNFIFNKYKKTYPLVIGSVYVLSIANAGFFFASIIIMYFVCALIVAILHIIRWIKTYPPASLKISYALTISVTYFLFWMPLMVVYTTAAMVVTYLEDISFRLPSLLEIMIKILVMLEHTAPVVIVVILRKIDKHFKIAYELVIRSTVRKFRCSNVNSGVEHDQDFIDSDVL